MTWARSRQSRTVAYGANRPQEGLEEISRRPLCNRADRSPSFGSHPGRACPIFVNYEPLGPKFEFNLESPDGQRAELTLVRVEFCRIHRLELCQRRYDSRAWFLSRWFASHVYCAPHRLRSLPPRARRWRGLLRRPTRVCGRIGPAGRRPGRNRCRRRSCLGRQNEHRMTPFSTRCRPAVPCRRASSGPGDPSIPVAPEHNPLEYVGFILKAGWHAHGAAWGSD